MKANAREAPAFSHEGRINVFPCLRPPYLTGHYAAFGEHLGTSAFRTFAQAVVGQKTRQCNAVSTLKIHTAASAMQTSKSLHIRLIDMGSALFLP